MSLSLSLSLTPLCPSPLSLSLSLSLSPPPPSPLPPPPPPPPPLSLSLSLSLLQYPLPEVVVIHRDPVCHQQLKQLESYVLEELNVKKLTLASEDSKYGVRLQGEPDNERLGKRLKGDFKKVAPAIKALTSEQVMAFQQSGEVTVEGYVLSIEDIKVCMFLQFNLSTCICYFRDSEAREKG